MTKHTVAVVGNPNSGKTTLFNGLTGGNQQVGNWPGVTVEKLEGKFRLHDSDIRLVDLPGIYSLSAFSEDERIARDFILAAEAELVINILDATNLERNLYLTCQLIELKVPMLIVLNMMDLADKKGLLIDINHLQKHLECSVIAVSANEPKDISRIRDAVLASLKNPKKSDAHVSYPNEIEEVLSSWTGKLSGVAKKINANERWVGLKLLEDDGMVKELAIGDGILQPEEIASSLAKINRILLETADEVIADAKYGFIHGVARDVIQRKEVRHSSTEAIDRIVMNRVWSIPIFFLAMYLVFWVTINIGGAFIDFFDILFGSIFVDGFGNLLQYAGVPIWLKTILSGGIGAGIQTVSTFIPIIFTMFFALSILEDSGYMARAAFIMDRFMRLIGLPGKSFVPMIVGFGCTVPAILGTRTLDNKQDRFLTIFMTPFMSCGARLPVYAFFAAVFFGQNGGNMVFSLYLVGILVAIGTGFILKRSLFKGETSHFIMELPPYHAPRLKHILIHTWSRLKIFIIRAGKVITLSVVVLGFFNSFGIDGSFGNENTERSVLSSIGKIVTPVFTPMGIEKENWPATVAIFSGIFAKEAVVGTLTSMYSQNAASDAGPGDAEAEFSLANKIGEAFLSIPAGLGEVFASLLHPFGFGYARGGAAEEAPVIRDEKLFSVVRSNFPNGKPQAYAYLLFILLYLPCVAALGAAVKEMGLLLGLFMAFYTTFVAWIIATLYYQIAFQGESLWILIPLGLLGLLIAGLKIASNRKTELRPERK